MKKSERNYTSLYFLFIVVLLYVITYFLKPEAIGPAFKFLLNIIKKIIPIFILIFVLMLLINYFVTPKRIKKYIGHKTSLRSWFVAIIGGILSTGPIYMWYPMLKDLRDKGLGNGFVATFLYNRAIKIPLIPMIVFYFGLKYTIILTIVMVIFSVAQGILIEKMEV